MSAVTKVNTRKYVNITGNCLDDVNMYMYNFELFGLLKSIYIINDDWRCIATVSGIPVMLFLLS